MRYFMETSSMDHIHSRLQVSRHVYGKNEAEYEGMLPGFDLLKTVAQRRLIICRKSKLVCGRCVGRLSVK